MSLILSELAASRNLIITEKLAQWKRFRRRTAILFEQWLVHFLAAQLPIAVVGETRRVGAIMIAYFQEGNIT